MMYFLKYTLTPCSGLQILRIVLFLSSLIISNHFQKPIPHTTYYTKPIMLEERPKPKVRIIPAKREFKRTRVALYCRVSTQMERQLNSLSAQMDFEKEDTLENPDWEYVDTYADIKSGRTISLRQEASATILNIS